MFCGQREWFVESLKWSQATAAGTVCVFPCDAWLGTDQPSITLRPIEPSVDPSIEHSIEGCDPRSPTSKPRTPILLRTVNSDSADNHHDQVSGRAQSRPRARVDENDSHIEPSIESAIEPSIEPYVEHTIDGVSTKSVSFRTWTSERSVSPSGLRRQWHHERGHKHAIGHSAPATVYAMTHRHVP